MQTVYLLCGLIGSGKSTWAKKKAGDDSNVLIINRDAIRNMIKGDYVFDPTYEPFVKASCYDLVTTALDYGFDVIIDETNITKEGRAEWFDLIDIAVQDRHVDVSYSIIHFTEKVNNVANRMSSPKGCTQENWQVVYEKMLDSLEEPSLLDELPEGTTLIRVSI